MNLEDFDTPEHAKFVSEYFRENMNGTRAYKAVYGQDLSDESAATSAWSLLRNVKIVSAIELRLKEQAMSANEVLSRLAEQARSDHSKYVNDSGNVDFAALKRDGKMHLLKSIADTKYGKRITFYDSQHALVQLGRVHALFTDKIESDSLSELAKEIRELINSGVLSQEDVTSQVGSELAAELFGALVDRGT